MSLQQAFRVMSLGHQKGPRISLRMMSLGSADYDTWQIYFPLCLEKILKNPATLVRLTKTFKKNYIG